MISLAALRLIPQYHRRVWGGQRLKPSPDPIGEAWIVYEGDLVASGSDAGHTLAELAVQYGSALLGPRAVARTGTRFPILIKLLDTADWLSVQVHPNDEQAARMEGADQFGKTEAWHILQADSDARLICGVRPGTSSETIRDAIRDGTILDLAQYVPVQSGDTVFVRAGTIHALGPGLLLYEVQQTSDITYRVFDWNRPQSAGRALHIEQSLAVSDPEATGQPLPEPALSDDARATLVTCPYFTLELVGGETSLVELDTGGESFHALTAIEGEIMVETPAGVEKLGLYETVIVPAACGAYRLLPQGRFRALKASV